MSKKKVDDFIKKQNKQARCGNILTTGNSETTRNSNPLKKESNDS